MSLLTLFLRHFKRGNRVTLGHKSVQITRILPSLSTADDNFVGLVGKAVRVTRHIFSIVWNNNVCRLAPRSIRIIRGRFWTFANRELVEFLVQAKKRTYEFAPTDRFFTAEKILCTQFYSDPRIAEFKRGTN